MFCLYHDTQMIVTFVMILLGGGPYSTNINMIKTMYLYIVLGYCLVRNVNLILAKKCVY